ncbi:hypothetical protein GYO_1555 [Bacillus spizizenii TU-B-10]|uniref:Uncharacterized protein n=1 Tax=Bacillus spizizenii (strain DSM 15029 / JCM 12233 / NBRC 101239 / NRRL B-23049 / TU-B-10) TaxID=1052585 RepID=G4NRY1_BACS4|nr:hypothetical protein GYO_1555 [Bacillus spizizenii TU-B-10]
MLLIELMFSLSALSTYSSHIPPIELQFNTIIHIPVTDDMSFSSYECHLFMKKKKER